MPTQPPVSSSDIARLVTEVLRRVRVEADERQTENSRIPPAAVTTVSDRVIAAETIVKLAPGTKVVHVARKAVITPSARDLARDRGCCCCCWYGWYGLQDDGKETRSLNW